jgi:RNA polymerase sigma-70 factor, ECF subfamily
MPDLNSNKADLQLKDLSKEDYEVIFKKFFPALKAYAQLFVQEQPAEDIVQDILVYLWENIEKIEIHTSLEAYLFKSVYQRCISHIKRQNLLSEHHSRIEIDLKMEELKYFDSDQNESIRRLFMNDLRHDLENAISSLPEKCQEVFRMSFINDFKNKEISDQLKISVNTVENHITKALKLLREKLSRYMPVLFLFFF